jgi:hypothetical protein
MKSCYFSRPKDEVEHATVIQCVSPRMKSPGQSSRIGLLHFRLVLRLVEQLFLYRSYTFYATNVSWLGSPLNSNLVALDCCIS